MKTTIKVGTLITNQKGDILLIKEKYSADSSYKWNIIKGTYDNISETLEDCIVREIKEEVNIDIKDVVLRRVYGYGNEENKRILFIFIGKIDKDNVVFNFKNKMKDEYIIEAKWFTKKELLNLPPKDCMDNYVYKSFDLLNDQNTKVDFINI